MVGLKQLVHEINGVHKYNEVWTLLISAFPDLQGCSSNGLLFEEYAKRLEWAYKVNKPWQEYLRAAREMVKLPAKFYDFGKLYRTYEKRQAFLEQFIRARQRS